MNERIREALYRLKRSVRRRTLVRRERETFHVGGQTLTIVDRYDLVLPWRSSRMLMVPEAGVFYSNVPLFSFCHRLLCLDYCVPPLRARGKAFYRRMLVLGCGGGAVPHWLLGEYPHVTVDVVELEQALIDICKKHFLKRWERSPRLVFHCIDASAYEAPAGSYQFIFCDIFAGDKVPPFVKDVRFLQKLHTLLSPRGILVVNCGFGMRNVRDIRDVLVTLFPKVRTVERHPGGTQVLVAVKE